MQVVTTRDLMCASTGFKLLFAGAIVSLVVGGILTLLGGVVDCSSYYSCSDLYTYYYYDCWNGYTEYCCSSNYKYCGDNYCLYKPTDYDSTCWGLLITGWAFYCLSFILALGVFIKFRNYRQRALESTYARMQPQYPPIYAHQAAPRPPVVVYSDQSRPANPQAGSQPDARPSTQHIQEH